MRDLFSIWTKFGLLSFEEERKVFIGFKNPIYISSFEEESILAMLHIAYRGTEESTVLKEKITWEMGLPKQKNSICIVVGEGEENGIFLEEESVFIRAKKKEQLHRMTRFLTTIFPNQQMIKNTTKEMETVFLTKILFLEEEKVEFFFGENGHCIMWEFEGCQGETGEVQEAKKIQNNLLHFLGLLSDKDGDFQEEELELKISIEPKCLQDTDWISSLLMIPQYLGMQSLACSYPMFFSGKIEEKTPVLYVGTWEFTKQKEMGLFIENEKKLWLSVDSPSDLIMQMSLFHPQNDVIKEAKKGLSHLLTGENSLGEALCYLEEKEISQIYGTDSFCQLVERDDFQIKSFFDGVPIEKASKDRLVFEKNWRIPWEGKRALDSLQGIFCENREINYLEIGVSEEKDIRESIKKQVEEILLAQGILDCKVVVRNAYKQGYSWLVEEIAPQLTQMKIARLQIGFRAFLREEKEAWNDVESARPSYGTEHDGDENRWFDLPIRRLQELYPVDDTLAELLHICRNDIQFSLLEDGQDYNIKGYDKDGTEVFQDSMDTHYGERAYLDSFPHMGKVHPCSGWILAKQGNEIVYEEQIETDLQRIWAIYQKEILPLLVETIQKEDGLQKEKQPFFKRMELEIYTSEVDEKLKCRKDLLSSLDTFHEDLYFVGLDYFKNLGMEREGIGYEQPGLFYPILHNRKGEDSKIQLKIILPTRKNPCYVAKGEEILFHTEEKNKIVLTHMAKRKENWKLTFSLKEIHGQEKKLKKIQQIIKNNPIPVDWLNGPMELVVQGRKNQSVLSFIPRKDTIADLSVDRQKPITYEQYIEEIKRQRKNGISVWQAAKSYEGREVWAIDLMEEGYRDCFLTSRLKLLRDKPSFLLNNRHHANEISSTNGAFTLLSYLLEQEQGKELLSQVLISILPMENVDGAKRHEELAKEHPEWIFHIARYNSVGFEFARDYFKETPYGEAKAFPQVWERSLPDVVVDNHGVPSHEWAQQFSGYVSPWFRGFWLPRALFYGYFWYVKDERYPTYPALNEAIQGAVSQELNRDEEIRHWNEEWKDRFETYANGWMPKTFPAEYYNGQIYYWFPYSPNKDAWHVSHRYPWITAVDWTTEVADETAQGEYLELCGKTHFLSDLATIRLLKDAQLYHREYCYQKEGVWYRKKVRKRPLSFD